MLAFMLLFFIHLNIPPFKAEQTDFHWTKDYHTTAVIEQIRKSNFERTLLKSDFF